MCRKGDSVIRISSHNAIFQAPLFRFYWRLNRRLLYLRIAALTIGSSWIRDLRAFTESNTIRKTWHCWDPQLKARSSARWTGWTFWTTRLLSFKPGRFGPPTSLTLFRYRANQIIQYNHLHLIQIYFLSFWPSMGQPGLFLFIFVLIKQLQVKYYYLVFREWMPTGFLSKVACHFSF